MQSIFSPLDFVKNDTAPPAGQEKEPQMTFCTGNKQLFT